MSKLAELRDSKSISLVDLEEILLHNVNSEAFIKPETVIEIIDKMNLGIPELTSIQEIIKSWITKYKKRKTPKSTALRTLSRKIEDKIKILSLTSWVKQEVADLVPRKGLKNSMTLAK